MVPCYTLGGWNALHQTRDKNNCRNREVFITAILGACQSIKMIMRSRDLRSAASWDWRSESPACPGLSGCRGVSVGVCTPGSEHVRGALPSPGIQSLNVQLYKWTDERAYYNSIFYVRMRHWQPHENSLNGQFSSFIDCKECKDTIKASFQRNIPRHA